MSQINIQSCEHDGKQYFCKDCIKPLCNECYTLHSSQKHFTAPINSLLEAKKEMVTKKIYELKDLLKKGLDQYVLDAAKENEAQTYELLKKCETAYNGYKNYREDFPRQAEEIIRGMQDLERKISLGLNDNNNLKYEFIIESEKLLNEANELQYKVKTGSSKATKELDDWLMNFIESAWKGKALEYFALQEKEIRELEIGTKESLLKMFNIYKGMAQKVNTTITMFESRNKELIGVQKELSNSRDELAKINKQIEFAKIDFNKINLEIMKNSNFIENQNQEIKKNSQELERINIQIRNANENYEKVIEKNNKVLEEKTDIERKLEIYKKQSEEALNKILSKQRKLQEFNIFEERTKSEYENLIKSNENEKQRKINLEENIKKCEEKLQNIRAGILSSEKNITNLNDEISELGKQKEKLNSEINSLNNQKGNLNLDVEEQKKNLNSEIIALQNQIKELEKIREDHIEEAKNYDIMQKGKAELENKIHSMKLQYDDLSMQIKEKKNVLGYVNSEIIKLEKEKIETENSLKTLKKDHLKEKEKCNDLLASKETFSSENIKLLSEYKDLDAKKEKIITEYNNIDKALKDKQKEYQVLIEKSKNLTPVVKEYEEKLTEIEKMKFEIKNSVNTNKTQGSSPIKNDGKIFTISTKLKNLKNLFANYKKNTQTAFINLNTDFRTLLLKSKQLNTNYRELIKNTQILKQNISQLGEQQKIISESCMEDNKKIENVKEKLAKSELEITKAESPKNKKPASLGITFVSKIYNPKKTEYIEATYDINLAIIQASTGIALQNGFDLLNKFIAQFNEAFRATKIRIEAKNNYIVDNISTIRVGQIEELSLNEVKIKLNDKDTKSWGISNIIDLYHCFESTNDLQVALKGILQTPLVQSIRIIDKNWNQATFNYFCKYVVNLKKLTTVELNTKKFINDPTIAKEMDVFKKKIGFKFID